MAENGRKSVFCVLLPVQGIRANIILCAVGVLVILCSLLLFLRVFVGGAVNLPAFYPWPALGAFCALFSLSVEIWEAIDKAASEQGISSERYTAELVQRLARDITAGFIQSRTGQV